MKDLSWSIMSESNQDVGKPQINGPISVDIPRGWTRILENDVVLYISPTNARLRSVEQVTDYLKTDGTCKCGLECPLYIHKVFNFDANVTSRFVREDDDVKVGSLQTKCKHYKENLDQNKTGEVPLQPEAKKMTSPSKTANKLPSFELLASEALKKAKAPARSRSRKTTKSRVPVQRPVASQRSASPLGVSPPPITSVVNNNPVQCVPSNLGRDKGPLPSFASIVSSFFSPGTNRIGMMPGTSATPTSTTTSVSVTTVAAPVSKPGADTAVTSVATAAPNVQRALAEPAKTPSTVAGASVKIPPTSLQSTSKLGTTSQASSLIAVSAGKQQAKAAPKTVASLSSTTVTSVSKVPVTAAVPVLSTGSTAAFTRTVTRPIILGSSGKSNSRQSTSARGKAKAAASATSKVDARSVTATATASRLSSASSGPAAVRTTATVSSSMLTSHSSSAFVQQRPNLPASVPVSFMPAPNKASVSSHGAVPPHHGVVPMNPAQSLAMASSAAAMTPVYQSPTMASFQQPLTHRGLTSAIPVYAAPTASVYGHQQQQHVTNVSQPQANVLGGSVHGKQLPTSASAFTQGQTSATVPQGTGVAAAAAAASQTQGAVVPGVLVQGAGGSQLFQMNFHNLDMGQFKGYQLQGTLYQHPFAGNAMAVMNTGPKGGYGNVPANQPSYASPYMFGTLLMQQTTSQATTGTTSVTTATAVSVTPGATTYFNQNAAIAAAFESFVPIAPAAVPGPTRYSQSLAHLASAYGQFAPGTLVRGSNPMQFPSMQVGNYPTNPMTAPVLTVPEYSFKYPVNAAKQTTYGPAAATTTPTTAPKCHVPTTVVAAVPYVAFGQMAGPRLPIALNFTPPGPLTSSQGTPGGGITVCGEASLATVAHPQYTSTGNVEAKTSDANTSSGVTATISSSTSGLAGGATSAFTTFQAQPKIAGALLQSSSSQPAQTVSSAPVTTASATENQRTASTTASSGNSLSSTSTTSSSASETWTTRSSCMLRDSFSGSGSVMSTTSSCTQPTHSVKNSGQVLEDSVKAVTPSKKQTAPNQPQSVFHSPPKSVCSPLNTMSQSYIASRETPTSASSPTSHTQNESCPAKAGSPAVCSGGLKRPFLNDNSQQHGNEGTKRTKYEPKEGNYYETNPLLGLKRSCEAIEVYCESDADKTKDNESKETNEKNCDGKEACNKKLDGAEDEFSSGKDSSKATGFSDPETNASFSHAAPAPPPPPISDSAEPSALYNGRTVRVKESVSEAPAPTPKLDPRLPSKTAPILPPAFQLPAFLGETAVPQTRPHFDIGDIVWAQARGLPSWPGKIVDETEVGKGRPDDGKKWVMWFGDNTFSQVEVDRLKTLTEGLRTLDDKARKKKYRAKKARISLEQAISEALEALDVREKLRARQASKGKTKKKRVR